MKSLWSTALPRCFTRELLGKITEKMNKSSQSNFGRVRRSRTTTQQSPLVTMGRPKITPNCPFAFDDNYPIKYTHPSTDRPHSPLQTASGSNQPFYHSTLSGQTDGRTDGQTDRQTDRHMMTNKVYQPVVAGSRIMQLPDFKEHPVVMHKLSTHEKRIE